MGVLSVDINITEDGESRAWNIPVTGEYMFFAVDLTSIFFTTEA